MNIDYRVVFIGNQGYEHKKNIKIGADNNEHDWMRYASDEYIGAFATFVVRMSAYIQQKARKYGSAKSRWTDDRFRKLRALLWSR